MRDATQPGVDAPGLVLAVLRDRGGLPVGSPTKGKTRDNPMRGGTKACSHAEGQHQEVISGGELKSMRVDETARRPCRSPTSQTTSRRPGGER